MFFILMIKFFINNFFELLLLVYFLLYGISILRFNVLNSQPAKAKIQDIKNLMTKSSSSLSIINTATSQ